MYAVNTAMMMKLTISSMSATKNPTSKLRRRLSEPIVVVVVSGSVSSVSSSVNSVSSVSSVSIVSSVSSSSSVGSVSISGSRVVGCGSSNSDRRVT